MFIYDFTAEHCLFHSQYVYAIHVLPILFLLLICVRFEGWWLYWTINTVLILVKTCVILWQFPHLFYHVRSYYYCFSLVYTAISMRDNFNKHFLIFYLLNSFHTLVYQSFFNYRWRRFIGVWIAKVSLSLPFHCFQLSLFRGGLHLL